MLRSTFGVLALTTGACVGGSAATKGALRAPRSTASAGELAAVRLDASPGRHFFEVAFTGPGAVLSAECPRRDGAGARHGCRLVHRGRDGSITAASLADDLDYLTVREGAATFVVGHGDAGSSLRFDLWNVAPLARSTTLATLVPEWNTRYVLSMSARRIALQSCAAKQHDESRWASPCELEVFDSANGRRLWHRRLREREDEDAAFAIELDDAAETVSLKFDGPAKGSRSAGATRQWEWVWVEAYDAARGVPAPGNGQRPRTPARAPVAATRQLPDGTMLDCNGLVRDGEPACFLVRGSTRRVAPQQLSRALLSGDAPVSFDDGATWIATTEADGSTAWLWRLPNERNLP